MNDSPPVYSSAKSRCGSSPSEDALRALGERAVVERHPPVVQLRRDEDRARRRPTAGIARDAAPANCPERVRTPGLAGPYAGRTAP